MWRLRAYFRTHFRERAEQCPSPSPTLCCVPTAGAYSVMMASDSNNSLFRCLLGKVGVRMRTKSDGVRSPIGCRIIGHGGHNDKSAFDMFDSCHTRSAMSLVRALHRQGMTLNVASRAIGDSTVEVQNSSEYRGESAALQHQLQPFSTQQNVQPHAVAIQKPGRFLDPRAANQRMRTPTLKNGTAKSFQLCVLVYSCITEASGAEFAQTTSFHLDGGHLEVGLKAFLSSHQNLMSLTAVSSMISQRTKYKNTSELCNVLCKPIIRELRVDDCTGPGPATAHVQRTVTHKVMAIALWCADSEVGLHTDSLKSPFWNQYNILGLCCHIVCEPDQLDQRYKVSCNSHARESIVITSSASAFAVTAFLKTLQSMVTAHAFAKPTWRSEVSMEQHRNEGAGETGYPRENTPTSVIVGHNSHMRKSNPLRLGDHPEMSLNPSLRRAPNSQDILVPALHLSYSPSWGEEEGLCDVSRSRCCQLFTGYSRREGEEGQRQSSECVCLGEGKVEVGHPHRAGRHITGVLELESSVSSVSRFYSKHHFVARFIAVDFLTKLNTISAYTCQKAKSKYRNRIQLERASKKHSSNTHKTPYDRMKWCRERKINIKASEHVDLDVFTQNKRRMQESCRTMQLIDMFSQAYPFPSALHSDAAPYSPHFTLIGSQNLVLKKRRRDPMRVRRDEYGAGTECKDGGNGKQKIPEKTRRPAASFSSIPTFKSDPAGNITRSVYVGCE
ncbi:hypothetical protein PR048_008190 [Dryococelus australis]|uniref:Uncharacterized protein n=1 Tax=Dryococelus australis TaxID=614101 RepID=A0ABQ9HY22_9NEOP|nr:hypothetical protein PR048_008190 [Dryococelus australis]